MTKKKIAGLLLLSPLILAILYAVGLFIYAYFAFYPVQMTIITVFFSGFIGFGLLASEDENEKK